MHSHNTAVEISIGMIDKTRIRSHGMRSLIPANLYRGNADSNLHTFEDLIKR